VSIEKTWFVGIDWATEEHAVCLTDEQGTVVAERMVPHSGAGLTALCTWLFETTGAQPEAVYVGIEVPHGPVVETLLERGVNVYAVNPKQLDRFRDRFTVAGAKDDRRDARVLADSLRTDRKAYRRVELNDPIVVELREWSRMHSELTEDRVRLTNRFEQQLLRYFPQMLKVDSDLGSAFFLALWDAVPTPQHAARTTKGIISKLLSDHSIRRWKANELLTLLREKPLYVAPGTVEAATAHIARISERLRLLNKQRREATQRLEQLADQLAAKETEPGQKGEQRVVEILRSLPGVGRIVLATLLAEAYGPLKEADYHGLRTLCGVAPVTKNSGKRTGKRSLVVMRKACRFSLREALYHWSRVAIQHDPKSKAAYAALRARGHAHGRALRTIGDRLLHLACAMLRTQKPYDTTLRQLPQLAA
jgi:transposase